VFTENSIVAPEFFSLSESRSSMRATGVEWTNPLEASNWDARLAEQNHPACSFFHSSAWANVLAETYGYRPFYFLARESGPFHSLLPFMEVSSALTGKRAIALPFTDQCEPLCHDKIRFKDLFYNAIELGKLRGWKYLEFRGGHKLFNGMPASLSFYGHSLDLRPGENTLFEQLKSSTRRAVRKAEKCGVRVEISTGADATENFYSLHCQTRKRHGLPPQPRSFFKNIHKHILAKDLGIVILGRWKKQPVAGAVFFHTGGSAIYKFGASDETFQHLRGNNLVMWEAIRFLLQRGVKKLSLGRTSIHNEGLRKFKLAWNAEEKNISYSRFSIQQEKFVSPPDESSGWHNRVFKALPTFVSRTVGNLLYRHWA
jgi:Acetyltransferase (GNAT) domain